MFWLEIARLAAPIVEKLLDKFFDLFKGASDTYNASAKTPEDLDKFVKDAKNDMGEFQKIAKEIDPNFKISGDADSASDFREIVKVLEQLKTQTTDKSQIESIDSMIKAFGDAAKQMDAPGYKGDKGDADLKIELPSLIPPSGNSYVGGYPAAPSTPTPGS